MGRGMEGPALLFPMTYEFRKNAYAALEDAQRRGARRDEVLVFDAPPGRYRVRLGDLKTLLWHDRQRRKRARRSARAAA